MSRAHPGAPGTQQVPTRDFSSLWGDSKRAESQCQMELSLCMLQDCTPECAWTQSLDQLW